MTTIFDGTLGVQFPDNSVQGSAATPQLMPVSASVAGNALTITLGACALAFRSTALGSGAVSVVQNSTTLSLTVPASATLGTVNATAARLVVIALNNAGTIELAVVNIAGGTRLDETNLLTTTTISSGATSASTVYSTTGRTSVAYRVVGFIDITEATAGTWATAPSTIQGTGGQALAAMSSLGYGQTWQDVTASRALSTTYYNTTGKPIFVSLSVTSAGNQLVLTINGIGAIATTPAVGQKASIHGIVPAGASYSAASTSASALSWTELR
jgi:hypothetical protein